VVPRQVDPAVLPRGKGDYIVSGTPEVREYPTLDHGLILLDATEFRLGEPEPTGDGTKVVYNPRLLACAPGRFAGACVT
jgi:hypothetical protein